MSTNPVQPAGQCRIVVKPSIVTPAVLRIHLPDKKPDLFFVGELACDVANARQFELIGYRSELAGHETALRRYSLLVNLPTVGSEPRGQCDCADGNYRGDKRPCKHIRAVSALILKGEL